MSVTIHIHKTHRIYTDGSEAVAVEGATVGECLDELVSRYPDLQRVLFEKKGTLSNTMEVYVNFESAYPDELARAVHDGDEIHLTLFLAGG